MGFDKIVRALQVTLEDFNAEAREVAAPGGIADEGSDDVPARDGSPGDRAALRAIGEIDKDSFLFCGHFIPPFNSYSGILTDGQSIPFPRNQFLNAGHMTLSRNVELKIYGLISRIADVQQLAILARCQ